MLNKKGFTLVELLVVIGIIGVLATISVASLNSAQQRARDTKRIATLKGMATMIEGEDAGSPGTAIMCGNAACGALVDVATVTAPSTLADDAFKKAIDPKDPDAVCTAETKEPCKFVIGKNDGGIAPLTSDYQICFYLEAGGAGLQRGVNSIINGAVFTKGCKIK